LAVSESGIDVAQAFAKLPVAVLVN